MDDEVIRRALGTGPTPDPSPAVLRRAIAAAGARRRRRGAVLGVTAVCLIGVAVATIARSGGEEIVGVAPAPGTTAGPSTSAVPISAPPASGVPATEQTTERTRDPVTTAASITVPPAVPGGTSAPFVAPPQAAEMPCDAVPDLTADRVTVSFVGPAPARADGVVQERFVGSVRTAIELWSASGRAAVISDTVPDDPDQWYCPTSLRPLGYDGQFVWAAVGGVDDCVACGPAPPAVVFTIDVTTGDVAAPWSSPAPVHVFDVLPNGDGGGLVLSGPVDGTGELVVSDTGGAVVGAWPVRSPVADARLRSDAASPTPDITYTTGASAVQPPRLHVVADIATGTEYVVDLTGTMIDPAFIGWSGGDGIADVLLVERWEGIGAAVLVRVDLASPQRSSTEVLGRGACWTETGLIARGTSTFSSETIYDEPGTVELVRPADLAVVVDLGPGTYGGALACLGGERVAVTMYDGVPYDVASGSPASIVAGSQRTMIVGGGESTELVRDAELGVVGRNADD